VGGRREGGAARWQRAVRPETRGQPEVRKPLPQSCQTPLRFMLSVEV
jgi:hypothetical protein